MKTSHPSTAPVQILSPHELVERFKTYSKQEIRDSLHRVRAAPSTPHNAPLKAFGVLARKYINGSPTHTSPGRYSAVFVAFKPIWDAAK